MSDREPPLRAEREAGERFTAFLAALREDRPAEAENHWRAMGAAIIKARRVSKESS